MTTCGWNETQLDRVLGRYGAPVGVPAGALTSPARARRCYRSLRGTLPVLALKKLRLLALARQGPDGSPLPPDRRALDATGWIEIARRLEETYPDRAGRAYTRAIFTRENPQAARLGRRKLGVAAASTEDLAIAAHSLRDRLALTEDPVPVSAAPLTGGFNPRVLSLTRCRFHSVGGVEHPVIVKEIADGRETGALPRGIAVHERIDPALPGDICRFPRFYGWRRKAGSALCMMEDVARGAARPGQRAEALGVLASDAALRSQAELVGWLTAHPPAASRRVGRKTLAALAEAAPDFPMVAFRRKLYRLGKLAEAGTDAPLPSTLSHGDAQTANMIAGVDGKVVFIDLDGLNLRPRGHDLARLVYYRWLTETDRSACAWAEIEEAAFAGFAAGLARMDETADEMQIATAYRAGLVAHIHLSLRRRARFLRRGDPAARHDTPGRLGRLNQVCDITLERFRAPRLVQGF